MYLNDFSQFHLICLILLSNEISIREDQPTCQELRIHRICCQYKWHLRRTWKLKMNSKRILLLSNKMIKASRIGRLTSQTLPVKEAIRINLFHLQEMHLSGFCKTHQELSKQMIILGVKEQIERVRLAWPRILIWIMTRISLISNNLKSQVWDKSMNSRPENLFQVPFHQ